MLIVRECRGSDCQVRIMFVLSGKDGSKRMCLEEAPHDEGNTRLTWEDPDGEPRAWVLPKEELAEARRGEEPLYISHFALCPNSDRFRQPREEARR